MKRIILVKLAIISALVAAEPLTLKQLEEIDPSAKARAAVYNEISYPLRPKYAPFSRAIAMPPPAQFLAVEEVNQEKRLPFLINAGRDHAEIKGYVRLSDNAIFLYRPETKDYVPSSQDPRLKREPEPIIKVQRPA